MLVALPAEPAVPDRLWETADGTYHAAGDHRSDGGIRKRRALSARADQSIFAGPGYDYVFLGTVQEQGVYTIVEESRDYEGNLWGKLKSGAGWVDLSEIRSPEYANALISANYAEEKLILQGDYHSYPGTGQGYEIPVAFRAYGRLRDVVLFPFELTETGLTAGQAIFAMDEWNGDMPLVAQLAFPGDMTTYGICFVDEAGIPHIYSIYISGRNGSLVLSRYEE